MGELLMCALSPHPPILIPEIGGHDRQYVASTEASMQKLCAEIAALQADVLVLITPHGPVFSDTVPILYADELRGSFQQFGASNIGFAYEYARPLADEIIHICTKRRLNAVRFTSRDARSYGTSLQLDHGALVPLYFLNQAGVNIPIVVIGLAFLSLDRLYEIGLAIRGAIDESDCRVCVLASGDLSHRVTFDAPAGYDPKGEVFDRQIVQLLSSGDVMGIMQLDMDLVEAAGECGLRPIVMMLGTLDGNEIVSRVYSYEAPFGVGYAVAALEPGAKSELRRLSCSIDRAKRAAVQDIRTTESEPVRLARAAVEGYVGNGRRIDIPEHLSSMFKQRAGVFVSIKKDGMLRGCIGTVSPTYQNIAEEIIENAVSAATRDPRFGSVEEYELEDLTYSVDILHRPEPVESLQELDPDRYGVIVRRNQRVGLLLPRLEGVTSVEEQVFIACQKAGIDPGAEGVILERFEVTRYT